MAPTSKAGIATRALHGDHGFVKEAAVAPPISVATTFRAPDPDHPAALLAAQGKWDPNEPSHDIYSRYTQPTLTRLEKVLSSVIGAPTAAYPSGIAATWAILLLVRPDVIAITDGYHGVHACFEVYRKMRGQLDIIKLDDDFAAFKGKKLLCWLETPLNPTGESRSIAHYAAKTRKHGATLAIDSTFAPPPLQDPFKWGADIVMHSGTKYFGGHSDALCGTVSVKSEQDWQKLWHDRTYTGSNLGSLESWLVLRSLRTLSVRVEKQSRTATALAQWLASLTRAAPGSNLDGPAGVVQQVWHTCLQARDNGQEWIGDGKQMTSGPACFAMLLSKPSYATRLGHVTKLFVPATSLGGVESLLEQRRVSDAGADPRLIRLSIGLEDFEDLKADLIQAFNKVVELDKESKL